MKFSPKVSEALKSGHLVGPLRDEFTRDICSAIKVHTMFPTKGEKEWVSSMIIQQYPFLADHLGAGPVSIGLCRLYIIGSYQLQWVRVINIHTKTSLK